MRYDFPDFHYREIRKIRFQNWGIRCYFMSSRSQKIKILQKLGRRDFFCLLSKFHFLWRFSCKN